MATTLTHRERVMRAISHQEIDRIPMYHRADFSVNERIKKKFKLKDDADILSHFDIDALSVSIIPSAQFVKQPDANGFFDDIFGNKLRRVQYQTVDTEVVIEPTLREDATIDDILKMKWPDKNYVNLTASIEAAKKARATGLAVYGGVWASLFTIARSIMGEENFLVATISNPELVTVLVQRLCDFYLEVNKAYFSACSKEIDIFYFGSDFGTQASLFISPDMFAQFFKPSFKRLVNQAKGYGLKVMFHTCGAVCDLIPHLGDCGIEVLDPVQVSAANMNPAILAAKYKGKIAFHGGISTQTTLPFGTPDQVRAEVAYTIKTFGPTGYIAAPDQQMIGDVSAENIEAMYSTIRECRVNR